MISTPTDYRPADWRPLEIALTSEFGHVAADAAASFWFIGFVAGPDDVGELRLYEHNATRRRLALDRDGMAFRWMPDVDCFCPIRVGDAFVEVLR